MTSPRIEADDRVDGILEQDGGAERSGRSGRSGPSRVRFRIEQLDEVRVLVDVQPVPRRTFGRDAAGIGNAVPVEHRSAAPRLGQRGAALRPDVPGDEAHGRLDALLPGDLGEAHEIVREPDEDGDAEAAHQGDLLNGRGVPPGPGSQQPGPREMEQRLANVVPAVHHPESVHRVDDVVVPKPVQAVGTREEHVLDFPVPGPVEDRLGVAGGAARRVEHRRVARASARLGRPSGSGLVRGSGSREPPVHAPVHAMEVAERRMFANALHEVLLGERRELLDVVEAADVSRLEALRPPAPRVERNLPAASHQAAKAPVLKVAKLVAAQASGPGEECIADRVLVADPIETRLFEVSSQGAGGPVRKAAIRPRTRGRGRRRARSRRAAIRAAPPRR